MKYAGCVVAGVYVWAGTGDVALSALIMGLGWFLWNYLEDL
jgi:hypothetical protein